MEHDRCIHGSLCHIAPSVGRRNAHKVPMSYEQLPSMILRTGAVPIHDGIVTSFGVNIAAKWVSD